MNSFNPIKSIAKLLSLFSLVILIVTSSYANPIKPVAKTKQITGVWQLKQTSENTKKSKSNFSSIISTPESLVVFLEENLNEVTINEEFKEFVQTQTLPTDGSIITLDLQQIGKVSSKAFWKDGKLFVETKTLNGENITEIFELSANQKQLIVIIQMTENKSNKSYKAKRIYHKISDVVENDENQEIELSIYPL